MELAGRLDYAASGRFKSRPQPVLQSREGRIEVEMTLSERSEDGSGMTRGCEAVPGGLIEGMIDSA